jgi:hypothetical protein
MPLSPKWSLWQFLPTTVKKFPTSYSPHPVWFCHLNSVGKRTQLWISMVCNCLCLPVTFSFLGPNNHLITLFWNIPKSPYFSYSKTETSQRVCYHQTVMWVMQPLETFSFILQWLYGLLLGPGLFLSFVIFFYTQSVGLLGWGNSPSQGHYLHTGHTYTE